MSSSTHSLIVSLHSGVTFEPVGVVTNVFFDDRNNQVRVLQGRTPRVQGSWRQTPDMSVIQGADSIGKFLERMVGRVYIVPFSRCFPFGQVARRESSLEGSSIITTLLSGWPIKAPFARSSCHLTRRCSPCKGTRRTCSLLASISSAPTAFSIVGKLVKIFIYANSTLDFIFFLFPFTPVAF